MINRFQIVIQYWFFTSSLLFLLWAACFPGCFFVGGGAVVPARKNEDKMEHLYGSLYLPLRNKSFK